MDDTGTRERRSSMRGLKIPSNFSLIDERQPHVESPDRLSILIIGNIAAGKSTFATEFSKLNKLDILELDSLRDCEPTDTISNQMAEDSFLCSIGKPSLVCTYVGMGLGKKGRIANQRANLIIRIHAAERTCLERIKHRNTPPPLNRDVDIDLLHYISETLDKRGFSRENMSWSNIPLIHISTESRL
jgi:hypothetical protein